MIVGKYLETEIDFINLVKVCTKYNELLLMYKFNPISNCDIFPNIQTQHFYQYRDIFYRKRDMFKYVYWIKPFLLVTYFSLIDDKKCEVKDILTTKVLFFCKKMNFNGYIHKDDILNKVLKFNMSYLILSYRDNYFGFIIDRINTNNQRLFYNDHLINANFMVSPSTVFRNKRLYFRNTMNYDEMITINFDDTSKYPSLVVEIESTQLLQYLPNVMIITDYCLLEKKNN